MKNNEIKTQRLLLRRICSEDWKDIQTIWASVAKTEYAQYDMPFELDDNAVKSRVLRWGLMQKSKEHMFFAACLEDIVIGYIALNKRPGSYELGYCFNTAYYRQGYAKESISAILDMMKQKGISKISAGTAIKNSPSVALLSSLGFEQVGTEQVSFYKDDEGNDIYFEGGIFEKEL